MALPSLATVADMERTLGVAPGTITGLKQTRAEESLKYASMLVRRASGRPWLTELGELDPLMPDELEVITTRAAVRDYRNPDGVGNEALGQGAYSYTYAEGQALVYLTPDEVELIQSVSRPPVTPGVWQGVGTIRTPSAYDTPSTVPTSWWETWLPGPEDYFPGRTW